MPGCLVIQSQVSQIYLASFCNCKTGVNNGDKLHCTCGEELKENEWAWNEECANAAINLILDKREVLFHPFYSSGTAVVRGDRPFVTGYSYYWEIKVLTPLYGTDVMIGVGTRKVDLQGSLYKFRSLLGSDAESWGYSYFGYIQHSNIKEEYGEQYDRGSIIGVHLDTWKGTLEFYLNRKPLGIAYTSLQGKTLYPMISSTAARSSLRVINSTSAPSTLQLMCLQTLNNYPSMVEVVKTIPLFQTIISRHYWWLVTPEAMNSDLTDNRKVCRRPQIIQNDNDNSDEEVNMAVICENISRNFVSSNLSSMDTSNPLYIMEDITENIGGSTV